MILGDGGSFLMKTFFIVFSFIMCSDSNSYQIYMNEIKRVYNGNVLMGNISI